MPPFRAQLEKLLSATDYLFGNETEAQAYAEAVGWETTDVEFIATRLSLVPGKGNKPPRKVVITQGRPGQGQGREGLPRCRRLLGGVDHPALRLHLPLA